MTKEEAIKYLQQLYPNGGHCWLDEQRIEAIGMAVKALQEEPVSDDLEKELKDYVNSKEYTNTIGTSGLLLIAQHFANWQKKRTIKKACEWWEKNDSYAVPTNVQIERFKQAMKQ